MTVFGEEAYGVGGDMNLCGRWGYYWMGWQNVLQRNQLVVPRSEGVREMCYVEQRHPRNSTYTYTKFLFWK